MNFLCRIEYVTLRLIRRYFFSETMVSRLGRFLPYYQTNTGEINPFLIIDRYRNLLDSQHRSIHGKTVLEVGSGRTNGVCYGIATLGAAKVYALEPFVAIDPHADARFLAGKESTSACVQRINSFDALNDRSVDLIVSNSVLEHVSDLDKFFADCRRVLTSGGVMIHIVDYRDHFFKYPYAFLIYSKKTWNSWLNPGDLPRWRLNDHLVSAERAGFRAIVVEQESLNEEFENVRHQISSEFDLLDPNISVTKASIFFSSPTTQ
jgi:SAM-dependent methyltransferase